MTKRGKQQTKTTTNKGPMKFNDIPIVFLNVGDYTRHWRHTNKLTQATLGSLIGYSVQMISDMESGRKYSERFCVMLMSAMKTEDELALLDIMKQQTVETILRRA